MGLARRCYKLIVALGALALLVAGGLAFDIWRYGQVSSPEPADAALVLGAAVLGDVPSPVLTERLRHARDLFANRQVAKILVTGGRSPEDDLTEAEASRRWLVAQGVPDDAIVLEDRSGTTQENLDFAKPLLQPNAIDRVLLVSDPFHMRRAMLIAERDGIAALPSPTPTSRYRSWATSLPFLAREAWFMASYLVSGH